MEKLQALTDKIQASTHKIQGKFKFQHSHELRNSWNLASGVFLKLGCWCLMLFYRFSSLLAATTEAIMEVKIMPATTKSEIEVGMSY